MASFFTHSLQITPRMAFGQYIPLGKSGCIAHLFACIAQGSFIRFNYLTVDQRGSHASRQNIGWPCTFATALMPTRR
jgi:hypothetical protein